MLPVADARRMILARLPILESETVPLEKALGRALASDMAARVSHPAADVSAMDGYAVRADDAATAPATLKVVGESAAGHPWSGSIKAGQAVRIFTGAYVPSGADAIVIQEDTKTGDGVVITIEAVRPGQHIRRAGQDFRAGDIGLRAPRCLTARDIGFLGAMNHGEVRVRRRPRVGIISTGDEIVMPGHPIAPGQLASANGPGLYAFATAHGAEAHHFGIAPDDTSALRALLERAGEVDILLTSGGVSVGDHDLIKQVLGDMGLDLAFHKIAMRPGKPLLFGAIRTASGTTPIMGLPGNPVAAMICAIMFLGPALDVMQGLPGDLPPLMNARLGAPLKANDIREDYIRAALAPGPDGVPVATPFPVQDSSMVSALARADVLIVRPPFAPAANAGDQVAVLPLD
ncbi:MAG: molybdopterin molybdenumtransferase MoeA [Rhodospirillaceae bacterium]|nr:MAG: molybdopterin molybdenumtransferase MoeA [Rhodospirillaceae bacterium]